MTLADPRRFTAPAATARGVSWSGGLDSDSDSSEVSLLRSLLSCCPILVAVGEIKPPRAPGGVTLLRRWALRAVQGPGAVTRMHGAQEWFAQ